jgi:hypothetical protein
MFNPSVRARTLAALHILNTERKAIVLRFLHDSDLLQYVKSFLYSLDLSNTDLNTIDLSKANLSRANLSKANLWGASITPKQLEGARNITPEQLAQIEPSKLAAPQEATPAQLSTTPAPSEIKADQTSQEEAEQQEHSPSKQDTDAAH